jgi:hypothetical protein
MIKLKLLIICTILILFSCTNEKDELTFGDFVEMNKLDRVKMSNNSGTFNLSNEQIEKIKGDISQMVYDPNISVKVGAISIQLLLDGKTYHISSATHGDYIEVHRDIIMKNKSSIESSDWLYFKTNDVNFDNYKNESN